MFEPPYYAPSTPDTVFCRCWACRDSGWVVSPESNQWSTVWTSCECRTYVTPTHTISVFDTISIQSTRVA